MNSFFIEYNQKKNIIENYIGTLFKESEYPQKNLLEIMEYAVLNGGKRIRPILMMGAYQTFFKDDSIDEVLPFCAAIELIHSYSLVHDDLPAMDNDSLRRGNPTAHIKFSHFGAILAGDALLNMAFEIMLNADNFSKKHLMAAKFISKASGADGMCAGQMTDMEGKISEFETLLKMYEQKTGALLKASLQAGAILGGASSDDLKNIEIYAKYLGIIFQIKDDILDVTSTDEIMGKNVKSDEKNQKITYVSKYGLEKSEELVIDYKNKALDILDNINGDTEFLKNLTEYVANREN